METAVRVAPEACWLIAVIAIPLAVDPFHIEPIVWPKTLLLLILASVLVVCGFARELRSGLEPFGSFMRRPLVTASLLLLAAQAISTYFSINPYLSVWGRATRNTGLLTFAACTLVFLAIVRYGTKGAHERLLVAVIFSGVLASSWALWASIYMERRVGGTVGNAIFLGAFLLVPIFLAASWIENRSRLMWPIFLMLLAAFFVATSRGPALGMITGFSLMAWRGARTVALVGIAVGISVFVARHGPTDGDSFVERVDFWEEAVETIDTSSVFRRAIGTGPDMWVYEGAGDHGEGIYAGVAHNVPMQVLVTTGLLGLAAYLWLWGVAAYQSAADWTLPALSALFVESLFGITAISALLMFWAMLAGISATRGELAHEL